jgi:pSer/pThr/pTyr-binding forkhead associated (FHA) protein
LLIGRHPECDVRIDLPKVSRRHCCIAQVYDRLVIRDLGSRNGLRVNGRLVDEALLRPGDEVAIGPLIYRLETELLASAPAPKPAPAARAPKRPPAPPRRPDDSGDLIPLDL